MKNQDYLAPAVQVVPLVPRETILTGSNEGYDLGNPFPGEFVEDITFIF